MMAAGEYKGVWIIAEQDGGRLQRVSHELLTRGRALADARGTELTAVLIGARMAQDPLQDLIARGADAVLAVEAPELEHFLIEPYAACLLDLIERRRPEIILAGATTTGRTLMPFVAVKANAGLTADCTQLEIDAATGNLLQTRPAIGGNILATIQTPNHRPQMATVRPHSGPAAVAVAGRCGRIERLAPPAASLASRVRRVDFIPQTDRCALAEAQAVVAVGRGIKKAANIPLAQSLADALGAALGASRDVVDRGWLSYSHQVGLSGKTVSPRLYIALGISGSIQHLAGMQTAQTIVAINIDPDAQIFQVADIGIVGSLFTVVPALIEAIRQSARSQPATTVSPPQEGLPAAGGL
ncbi:MAG: electron transfer flavoprotein subunit alpha/FixB family protein [Planctomycetaceae bacterium]|nr:electron transfer flavoprotein subunit alpha/FixB family protein [Planctomycetaceae bacterium]